MIAKAGRGSHLGKLVAYLFNEQPVKGHANEHVNPRAIAAGAGGEVPLGRGLDQAEQRALTGLLEVSSDLYGTKISGGNVYHVSLATRGGTDRDLSDAEWGQVAAETVAALGFAGPGSGVGEGAPCAWVAVRHGKSAAGNDHLHLAVNLVREGGAAASVHQDRVKLSKLCARLEVRFGLSVIEGRASKTGMPGVSKAEAYKTVRTGVAEPERVGLARVVRAVALAAGSEDEFVRRSRAAGLAVAPYYDTEGGTVRGYAVARAPAVAGEPAVFFGGGKLGRDLTLPALRRGWEQQPDSLVKAAREWGPYRGGPSGRLLRMGWEQAAGQWGPGRRPAPTVPAAEPAMEPAAPPETEVWESVEWQRAGIRLGQVVQELAQIPAADTARWAAVAHDAAGLLAGLSVRLEPTPGPLARAADVMARSAQGPTPAARPATAEQGGLAGAGSLRTVAAVMAQAQITNQAALGWQLMLASLLRLAQTINAAHLARDQAQQAGRLADQARSALDATRAQLDRHRPAGPGTLSPEAAAAIDAHARSDPDPAAIRAAFTAAGLDIPAGLGAAGRDQQDVTAAARAAALRAAGRRQPPPRDFGR